MAQMKAAAASAASASASASAAASVEDLCTLTAAIDLAADCILPHCALTPTRPFYSSIESVTVVDLREALLKGVAHAGSSTSCLQLCPPPKSPAGASERKQAEDTAADSHPLVRPSLDATRHLSEVDFVRSLMCELSDDTRVSFELQSLHRLFNRQWLFAFLAHQKVLAPQLFKSHVDLWRNSMQTALVQLIKYSNRSDVGTPVFAWHGTTAAAIPSILQHGLSTRFSRRGGVNIWTSQQFEHSFAYCKSAPGEGSHLLLCLVLRNAAEIAACKERAYGRLAIPDSGRVLPMYHLVVKCNAPAGAV